MSEPRKTSNASAKEKAQRMLDQVRDGKTVFTRSADQWLIVGPADRMIPGHTVDVTKADGTVKTVRVHTLHKRGEVQGVTYQVAEFTPAPTGVAPGGKRGGYRTVSNSAFGEGRVYRSQPGATQYDDGSGRYNVQIWDNE
jgi:hypothetical protein